MSTEREQQGTRWKSLLIVEWIALLIALAMPITPSKTGGDFSFADLFFEDPNYFQEVLVYFLVGNLLLGVLALIVMIVIRRDKRSGEDEGSHS
jgi:hypothetical protein